MSVLIPHMLWIHKRGSQLLPILGVNKLKPSLRCRPRQALVKAPFRSVWHSSSFAWVWLQSCEPGCLDLYVSECGRPTLLSQIACSLLSLQLSWEFPRTPETVPPFGLPCNSLGLGSVSMKNFDYFGRTEKLNPDTCLGC